MLMTAPIAQIESQSLGDFQSIESAAFVGVSETVISFVSVASRVMCDPVVSAGTLFVTLLKPASEACFEFS